MTISPAVFSGSTTGFGLHNVTITNTSGSVSSGFVKFGLALEKNDVPNVYRLGFTVDGVPAQAAMIDRATWSNGSIRKATIAINVGNVASGASVVVVAFPVFGSQGVNILMSLHL